MENQGMILHFGVRIKKSENNKIARENYANKNLADIVYRRL